MVWNFLNLLTLLTIFSGIIVIVDVIWCQCFLLRPQETRQAYPWVIEYARSFFPILLLVLIVRAFLIQPYRVPTGSLEPTIMPGDFILVNQYDYGLHWPLTGYLIFPKKTDLQQRPQRGQIALFNWPVNPAVTFVKRVIGLPGDRISYLNKVFYINGKKMNQTFIKNTVSHSSKETSCVVQEYEEDLEGIKHRIFIKPTAAAQDFENLLVPKDQYLVIGDNRDDSNDSRIWGFVPLEDFMGRALFIWMSWDRKTHRIRWQRIGIPLKTPG